MWIAVIACILLIVIIGCILISIEIKKFRLTEYEYKSDKLLKDEFTAVVLSDLHNYEYGRDNKRLVQAIKTVKPDAVLLAGDMIESTKGKQIQTTLTFLKKIAEEFPIYYGCGNHESRVFEKPHKFGNMSQELEAGLQSIGLHVMRNEVEELTDFGIKIYGLELEHKYYRKIKTKHISQEYMETVFGKADERAFSILLAHNPEHFPEYAKWGADLVLSGHVHGGIIGLPGIGGLVSPQVKLFPKYDRGEFKEDKSTMILSAGIGTHTLPIRIFNRAEVVVVKIKKLKS